MALDEAQRLARGERIKQLREESAFTQPALAEKVGVTLRAYQRWEEGGGIEWDHLEKLAEIHGVDVQWIHRGKEKGPTPDPFASDSPEIADALRALQSEVAQIRTKLLARVEKLERQVQASQRKTQAPRARRKSNKNS